jgi:hypothetical protein
MRYRLRELVRMPRFWIAWAVAQPFLAASFMAFGFLWQHNIVLAFVASCAIWLPTMLAVRFVVRGSIS